VASNYWSSSTGANFPVVAWVVNFDDGLVGFVGKNAGLFVRAVRGGSP